MAKILLFAVVCCVLLSGGVWAQGVPQAVLKETKLVQRGGAVQNGSFFFKVRKGRFDFLPGLYRSRQGDLSSSYALNNFNLSVLAYFPFSYALQYYDRDDEIMTIDIVTFLHISRKGNHGVGLGPKLRFLLYKNFFLSYQLGIGWFEHIQLMARDGLEGRGVQFNHIASLSKQLNDRFDVSFNFIHTSNGGMFKLYPTNNQDVLSVGLGIRL